MAMSIGGRVGATDGFTVRYDVDIHAGAVVGLAGCIRVDGHVVRVGAGRGLVALDLAVVEVGGRIVGHHRVEVVLCALPMSREMESDRSSVEGMMMDEPV
jgi:hypothetical protein